MRLHHLEVTAFGPFADTVTVDFDELSEAGLFLLSGATGAGKTSVLDAVCFALYGDVPGDRSAAKRLRSDQADPGVAPRVSLETTVAGRRLRIVRSPSWRREKRRGSGTTTEQASVTVSELVEGAWRPLSSRIDESGHLISGLLGMTLTQFTQVAMLPQGRFQAFLRASSEERHRVLQQLFHTGRFERVEHWLRDRRTALRRDSEVVHQRVADLASRVSEAADVDLPAPWDVHDLAPAADDGSLRWWSEGQRAAAERARRTSEAAGVEAAADETVARAALEQARTRVERIGRLERARGEHDRLTAAAAEHHERAGRLDAARRATAVLPLQRVTTTARLAVESTVAQAATALERALRHVDRAALGPDELVEMATTAADGAAAVRAARPREQRLDAVTAALGTVQQRRSDLAKRLAQAGDLQRELPERIECLQDETTLAEAAGSQVAALRVACEAAADRVEAHRLTGTLGPQLEVARREWLDARAAGLDLQEQLVALQQARIEGMAAELAGALAVGGCCPVCGSAEHPAKATAAPGAPDRDAEKHVRRAIDDAKLVEHVRDQRVRDLETRLAVMRQRAGSTTSDEAAGSLRDLTAELDAAEAADDSRGPLERQLTVARDELRAVEQRRAELATADARVEAEHTALTAESSALRAEIEALLSPAGLTTLDDLLRHHQTTEAVCRDALRRHGDVDSAQATAAEAERDLVEAAAEAGFVSVIEAVTAALDAPELTELADRVSEHQRRLAAVTEVLSEPGADELTSSEPPDVAVLEADHGQALTALSSARSDARLWSTRLERLATLVVDLDAALRQWAPIRAEHELAVRLSSFVEGKAADNRWQMRLSAYVLAYRLSQVVDAANVRLAQMSDQRYSLEHTGHRGAGERRGGLSLLVRDDWSGESRDPATLSGGETFVVSLALALGLADVISHEAGGSDLHTLFVDEGFGALDSETLDDVMDVLDSLRDGGRVVGVVSHVAEMRDRIPTQLVVTKSRRGSALAVRR